MKKKEILQPIEALEAKLNTPTIEQGSFADGIKKMADAACEASTAAYLEALKPYMLDGTEKVGQRVWDVTKGWLKIVSTNEDNQYPIKAKDDCYHTYTKEGRHFEDDKLSRLFKTPPFWDKV